MERGISLWWGGGINLVGLRGLKMDGGEVADSLLSIGKRDPRENMWRTRNNVIELTAKRGKRGEESRKQHTCRDIRGTLPSTDIPRSAGWICFVDNYYLEMCNCLFPTLRTTHSLFLFAAVLVSTSGRAYLLWSSELIISSLIQFNSIQLFYLTPPFPLTVNN